MPPHIVNLGSSFAAGPGLLPQLDAAAKRSGANYAHLLADRLGSQLTDLSVSGATLLNILQAPQTAGGRVFAAQVAGVPEDADVVLVLGGGNDLGYIGGLVRDSLCAAVPGLRLLARPYSWARGARPVAAAAAEAGGRALGEAALSERYGRVLDAVHARAPTAQVVVVEYLTLLGHDARPRAAVPLAAAGVARHRAVAETLRLATARAIHGREAWCTRVAVAEASWEHGVGSKEPWVHGFGVGCLRRKEACYHPNAAGMAAVADMIYRALCGMGLLGTGTGKEEAVGEAAPEASKAKAPASRRFTWMGARAK